MSDWESTTRAGLVAHTQGRYEEAAGLLESALEHAEAFGYTDTRLHTTLIYYATNELARGRLDAARKLFDETLELIDENQLSGRDFDLNRATCLNNLALIYKHQEDFKRAETTYQEALRLLERYKSRDDPMIAATRSNIAVLYMREGNFGAAELLLLEALHDETHGHKPSNEAIPTSLHQLASAYIGQSKLAEAERLYSRCIDIWNKHGWPENLVGATILEGYADLLRATERTEDAEALEEQARDIRSKRA